MDYKETHAVEFASTAYDHSDNWGLFVILETKKKGCIPPDLDDDLLYGAVSDASTRKLPYFLNFMRFLGAEHKEPIRQRLSKDWSFAKSPLMRTLKENWMTGEVIVPWLIIHDFCGHPTGVPQSAEERVQKDGSQPTAADGLIAALLGPEDGPPDLDLFQRMYAAEAPYWLRRRRGPDLDQHDPLNIFARFIDAIENPNTPSSAKEHYAEMVGLLKGICHDVGLERAQTSTHSLHRVRPEQPKQNQPQP
jgi:hypothetical protein